jgi:hypothetical protein
MPSKEIPEFHEDSGFLPSTSNTPNSVRGYDGFCQLDSHKRFLSDENRYQGCEPEHL